MVLTMPQPVLEIIKAPDFSDGDLAHRPDTNARFIIDPEPVLRMLASRWMRKNPNDAEPGKVYIFDKLPAGYTVYGQSRGSGRVDKYIYGHPKHKDFRSIEQFFSHFCYLALHQEGNLCDCVVCMTGENRERRKAAIAKTSGVRPRVLAGRGPRVKESSPASLPTLSTLLREEGDLDIPIEERQNMDWRGENEMVGEVLHHVSRQPSFVPRVGELVLWCDRIDGEIRQDPSSGDFWVFDPVTRTRIGYPQWMGGVVTQAPISEQPVSVEDISREPEKEYAVTSSGFRIEWYPGPNGRNKNLSKRYSHVPMHHIRPLAFWMEYMAGIPNEDWHPTIKNCLKAMGTLSTINRYRLKGARPAAKLYAKGCFLGAEALYAGDIIRVSLDRARVVTEVLKIHAVVTRVENIPTSDGDRSRDKSQRMHIEFHGSTFTLDPKRSNTRIPIDPLDFHEVMRGYGPWFYVGLPSDMVAVDHSQILGRLFEKQAMQLWSPRCRSTVMDIGCKGVLEAREYARKCDCRKKHAGGLYVAESRADSLNLGTFNGIDVGAPGPEIDPYLWQNVLAALDGIESEEEHSPAEGDPKFAKTASALNPDSQEDESSSEDSQEVDDEGLDQRTEHAAIASRNQKRNRRTESDDEGSLDELQSSSPRKRGRFVR